jgi:ABC-type transport system involved in multi-copper enzyme maturation permease subunit
MYKILAIARNTFRENVRDRILYNLVLFALVMILSAVALGQLALGQERKVIIDLGLSSISIFGVLIAVFIGTSLVYKEIEKRTVYALLAKPIHRRDLILGKYLGLLFTLLVNVAVMAAGLMLTLAYFGETGVQAYLRLLPAVYLIFLSLMVTTALALLFSTFSTPALSALFTLFLWVIGHFNRDLLGIGKLTDSAALEWLGKILYYFLPNFSNFETIGSRNIIQSAAYSKPIDPIAIGWITVYGLICSSLLVALSAAIFSRRDFK